MASASAELIVGEQTSSPVQQMSTPGGTAAPSVARYDEPRPWYSVGQNATSSGLIPAPDSARSTSQACASARLSKRLAPDSSSRSGMSSARSMTRSAPRAR